MSDATKAKLEEAIRDHYADESDRPVVVVGWVLGVETQYVNDEGTMWANHYLSGTGSGGNQRVGLAYWLADTVQNDAWSDDDDDDDAE